jgi:hypothetical protein
MLGLVLTLAVTLSPAMPSASVTCPGWPASCDGAWGSWGTTPGDATADAAVANDSPREYATPVEVDCPTPPEPAPVATGECSEPPILNLWYRVSRSPDSEAPTGSLAPAPRRTRAVHLVSAGGRPIRAVTSPRPISSRWRWSRCPAWCRERAAACTTSRRGRFRPALSHRPIGHPGPDRGSGFEFVTRVGNAVLPAGGWFSSRGVFRFFLSQLELT